MRTKDEILTGSHKAISKAPKEGQEMLEHEHLMLEIFIDIRDTLKDIHEDYGHLIRGYFDIPN